ncbi:MAG: Rrf2 family transcriptional regulator [Denitrovibrio sp.]|nr:MAG: Rrf2 family transcriptional regulator [Denitrovibrio sp.]
MDSFIHREEDYALRIIIYLATVKKMVKTKEICASLYLSRPIVLKIVNKLKNSGYLITKTGKDGGLSVSEDVYNASIYDILIAMGFTSRVNQCLSTSVGCQLMCICKVNSLFSDIQNSVEERLKNAKIKEFLFTNNDQKLVNLNNRRRSE